MSCRFFVRVQAFLLALCLVLSLSVPAYAGQATSSNADRMDYTFSLSHPDLFPYVSDDGISTVSAGLSVTGVQNTVSYSGMYVVLYYNTTQGGVSAAYSGVDSGGYFNFSRPSNFASPIRFAFGMKYPASIPSPGNYSFSYNIIMNTGVTYKPEPNNSTIYSSVEKQNVLSIVKGDFVLSSGNYENGNVLNDGNGQLYVYNGRNGAQVQFTSYGDYYCYVPSLAIKNISNISFVPYVFVSSVSFPCNGVVKFQFGDTDASPVLTTAGTIASSGDIQQDMSNQISGISSTVSQISSGISQVASGVAQTVQGITNLPGKIAESLEPHYDNILQQLHHITEQLHAFWDQLAAYFNDTLVPKMDSNTDRIVEAIENIDLEVNVSMTELLNTLNKNHQEQLANDDKNHQAQLANDDKNTDTIVNGYDNKPFQDANDKLSDTLGQYGEKEDELLEDVNSNIENFEYENPFDKYTAPLYDISHILNVVYAGLGGLNIPIAFNLTLSIALICIGWYRFKGGV